MTNAHSSRAVYVITADAPEGIIQQTRYMAASAVILARRWIETGYVDVRISDPKGDLLTPEMLRARTVSRHRGIA